MTLTQQQQRLDQTIQRMIETSSPDELAELQQRLIEHTDTIERLLWQRYRRNAA